MAETRQSGMMNVSTEHNWLAEWRLRRTTSIKGIWWVLVRGVHHRQIKMRRSTARVKGTDTNNCHSDNERSATYNRVERARSQTIPMDFGEGARRLWVETTNDTGQGGREVGSKFSSTAH